MYDADDSEPKAPNPLGIIGVAFAVFGICPIPWAIRIICLAGACVCFPLFFHCKTDWPPAVRWLFSLAAVAFFAYAAWSIRYPP